ncbi:MAG: hypothetical protein ABII88_00095 [Candidatus Omnitrophota bacterium]
MLVSSNYSGALGALGDKPNIYGKNNELLYLLDRGYIEHLGKQYKDSIDTFKEAQQKSDDLYTKSVSKIAATWIINDYSAPYHGEDFEHVLINIFQAINYALNGNYEDALVEARDVDSKLNVINSQYDDDDKKNVYKEDAFARLLMGIFYECSGTNEDLNDAFISYRNSAKIYENDYTQNYGGKVPRVLKENLLTTARFMGLAEFGKYKLKYRGVESSNLDDKKTKGEIYLIQYVGLSPVKVEESLTVPLPDGAMVKVAFPKYQQRPYGITSSRLLAAHTDGNVFFSDSDLVENIGAIAVKNLESRKLRFMAKSALRAAGRYMVEKKQEKNVKEKFGDMTAGCFRFLANIYNIVAEQADLRCWQTLPDQIRMARLILSPGEYELSVESFGISGDNLGAYSLGKIPVRAGEKKFFILHTPR